MRRRDKVTSHFTFMTDPNEILRSKYRKLLVDPHMFMIYSTALTILGRITTI